VSTGERPFEEVFQDLFVRAHGVAERMLGDRIEAEDVAAETMAQALDRWDRVGRMASPTGWVVRVAGNQSVDILRRRRFTAGPAEPVERAEPVDMHAHREGVLAMRDLLDRLPKRQREVVTLRYFGDLSEAEIARTLGISAGSVKRHASRALVRLRPDCTLLTETEVVPGAC
jgi:RNA polymerase sigma factor (sigma-70 family)